ncbi:MAG: hypothetical protein ACI9XZ_001988 [Alphaproteobacteria bacterium]|jgi:hypothetical protein
MLDQYGQLLKQQGVQAVQTSPPEQRLTAAAYVNEVTRHLSRLRQTSAANVARRI